MKLFGEETAIFSEFLLKKREWYWKIQVSNMLYYSLYLWSVSFGKLSDTLVMMVAHCHFNLYIEVNIISFGPIGDKFMS